MSAKESILREIIGDPSELPARSRAGHSSPDSPVTAGSPFLTLEEAAERERVSIRTMRELARTNRVPHLKRPGARRCLFRADELDAWEAGAELEVEELPDGGRVVRPVERAADES